VKPKTSGKDEERTGPFYCKNVDGSAASELHTLRKLNELLKKGHIEITKLSTSSCRKISRSKVKTETGYQPLPILQTCENMRRD
jgi:aryl-alcohol dehydrogenase-like predicted oxidoreductase